MLNATYREASLMQMMHMHMQGSTQLPLATLLAQCADVMTLGSGILEDLWQGNSPPIVGNESWSQWSLQTVENALKPN